MAGSRRIIEYKDFSGGEWGNLEPWKADKNQFTGLNMLVYKSGQIGPRPGIREFTPTGIGNGLIATFDMGYPWGFGFVQSDGSNFRVRRCTMGEPAGSINTFTGNLPNPPSTWDLFGFGNRTWYISTGPGGIYRLQGVTPALTQLSSASDLGQLIVLHGDRLVTANCGTSGSTPSQIRYSDAPAPDHTSWPSTNSILVGDPRSPIRDMYEQRGNIVLVKDEGTYVLSGVIGVNEVLRRALHTIPSTGPGMWPVKPTHQDGVENIWGLTGSKHPAYYNGSVEVRDTNVAIHSETLTFADKAGVAYVDLTEEGGQCFVQKFDDFDFGNDPRPVEILLRHRGVWSRHRLAEGLEIDVESDTVGGNLLNSHVGMYLKDPGILTPESELDRNVRQSGAISLVQYNGSGSPANFYEWMPGLDRPGFEIEVGAGYSAYNYERAGDDSDEQVAGNFSLREERFADGTEIRVRGLVIDFEKWDTGGSLTNHFDVKVDTLRPYEGTAPISSSTFSFDEASASASTAGTLQRKYFSVGDNVQGGGFQVHFTNVRGLAIQRIQVIIDTYEPRF